MLSGCLGSVGVSYGNSGREVEAEDIDAGA
jgi:hypothetical protein